MPLLATLVNMSVTPMAGSTALTPWVSTHRVPL
jgi:hypothetical protein